MSCNWWSNRASRKIFEQLINVYLHVYYESTLCHRHFLHTGQNSNLPYTIVHMHSYRTHPHIFYYLDGPEAGLVGPVDGLDGAGGFEGAVGLDEGGGGLDGLTPA